ncbi:MAG: type II toxin-antitoxin system HicB family antitoxin [Oscillospiraceae bacterium]|jgi:predicted RNase H-like HicB family nuclease|nr:type II toxin-antitoxin system HicB family antitoxin [Oscillospiraceae bacterium]
MEFVYPAVFHPNSEDGSITITFPDIRGCISEGKNLANALYMASDALKQMLDVMLEDGDTLPKASKISDLTLADGEFANLVRAEVRDEHAVRRTLSLPKWLDEKAVQSGVSLSRILQEALVAKLA